jgi:hypothetical protein
MTRPPFWLWVAAATALAGFAAWAGWPGRPDVAVGAALGALVAGTFAGLAVWRLGRNRLDSGAGAVEKLARGFAGLMLARMVVYGAFITAILVTRAVDPIAACSGLVLGTIVFQGLEIVYLKSRIAGKPD